MNNNIDFLNIYNLMFDNKFYNLHPSNEFRFQLVINYLEKNKISSMIDIGTGRGAVLEQIIEKYNDITVYSSDLNKYHNLDIPFYEINLCDGKWDIPNNGDRFDLLTCLDVMEHLTKDCVDRVLKKFSEMSENVILTIANHSDVQNGIELHLIREDSTYWSPIISQYFDIVEFSTFYNDALNIYILKSKKKYE